MPASLRCTDPKSLIAGWDFSTGGVKCLIFNLEGQVVAQHRLPTDLYRGEDDEQGAVELSLLQLEGQARSSARAVAAELRRQDLLESWVAAGISATHHTAGRIDADHVQVRRAICWNDQTLGKYRQQGEKRLGGPERMHELIGGPWADRYSLSHLVKDEDAGQSDPEKKYLSPQDWRRTKKILLHGPLAAGYLTGNFEVTSISSAASTGIMDMRTGKWRSEMLDALESEEYRRLAWEQLPRIVDQYNPVGRLSEHVCLEAGIDPRRAPLVFPTSDDQQAGLIGGGAVGGQVAVILGNSAVVNSSSNRLPESGSLDVMRLNWGPYLWMRCYSNGAQFLDHVVGKRPDWKRLEAAARAAPHGSGGVEVMPFVQSEPSLGVKGLQEPLWHPARPHDVGQQFRASLEAIAYLIALAIGEHEAAGQKISRISVSGGIARSDLMCEILASVVNRPLERLLSDEGPALGAAVTALAAYETHGRRAENIEEPFTPADAVAEMVRFRPEPARPNEQWTAYYARGLESFQRRVQELRG